MIFCSRKKIVASSFFAVLALSACSSGHKAIGPASAIQPVSVAKIEEIAALLDRGEVQPAKKRIEKELKRDPMNPSLQVLLQGIAGDARSDLGPSNFSYVVRPGDTMAELAQRFLGNRLKSYQLGRYNGIDEPSELRAGTELRIPGQSPRAEPSSRNPARPNADIPSPTTQRKEEAKKPEKAEKALSVRKTGDPAAARRARSAGLIALNQGRVVQAVTLLRRAAALGPDDKAIAADLARAERIAATVKSRQ